MSGTGKIVIKRSNQLMHGLSNIKIIFNNNTTEVISTCPNDVRELNLSCGNYVVYAKLQTFYSKEINLILNENQTIYLDVGLNIKGFFKTLLAPYYWLFKRKSYLYIRNVSELNKKSHCTN